MVDIEQLIKFEWGLLLHFYKKRANNKNYIFKEKKCESERKKGKVRAVFFKY